MAKKYNYQQERSYKAYLSARDRWQEKGYHMDKALNKRDFHKIYEMQKLSGMKNIVREMAKHDRAYSLQDARGIVREIQKLEFKSTGNKEKDKKEKAKLDRLKQRYQTPEDVYSRTRKSSFEAIATALGYEGAREVYDAVY